MIVGVIVGALGMLAAVLLVLYAVDEQEVDPRLEHDLHGR